jgi:hypothetical protein
MMALYCLYVTDELGIPVSAVGFKAIRFDFSSLAGVPGECRFGQLQANHCLQHQERNDNPFADAANRKPFHHALHHRRPGFVLLIETAAPD